MIYYINLILLFNAFRYWLQNIFWIVFGKSLILCILKWHIFRWFKFLSIKLRWLSIILNLLLNLILVMLLYYILFVCLVINLNVMGKWIDCWIFNILILVINKRKYILIYIKIICILILLLIYSLNWGLILINIILFIIILIFNISIVIVKSLFLAWWFCYLIIKFEFHIFEY